MPIWQNIFLKSHKNAQIGTGSGLVINWPPGSGSYNSGQRIRAVLTRKTYLQIWNIGSNIKKIWKGKTMKVRTMAEAERSVGNPVYSVINRTRPYEVPTFTVC